MALQVGEHGSLSTAGGEISDLLRSYHAKSSLTRQELWASMASW